MQNAHIVIGGSTLIELFSLDGYNQVNGVEAAFSDVGITVLLAIIGVIITGILVIKNVKGNILWGILITWVLGIIAQLTGWYVVDPDAGAASLIPSLSASSFIPPSISSTFCKFDFAWIGSHVSEFVVIVFSFLFVDMFDTIGTVIGVAEKSRSAG